MVDVPLFVHPPSLVGRAMFTAPVKAGNASSTVATAMTIAQLTSPAEMCQATTVQNSSATSHGTNRGTASDRLRMVKLRMRLRRLTPTAAHVSPLNKPRRGVR